MSDTAVESPPTKPFYGVPIEGELSEIPPQVGYVVFQLNTTTQGAPLTWAWCRVVEGQPGFANVDRFTGPDGVTTVDPGTGWQLGAVLFKVFC
jgi:hypothetical protein